MITPSSLATRSSLLARGKDAPIQKFSSSFSFDRTQAGLLESTYRHDANVDLITATLSDSDIVTQFAFVNNQGRVGVFTCPKLFQDPTSRELSFVGSYSDDIGDAFPMAVSSDHFKGRFTTLIPKELCDRFSLSILEQVPDNIPPPQAPPQDGDVDPAMAQDEDGAEAPSMERLQFGDTSTEARHPRIAALPTFFPLPKGKRVPCDLDLVADDLPADLEYIPLEMWLRGYKYLLTHNDGFSVTKGGPLFALHELDTDGPLFDAGGIVDRPQLGPPVMLQPGLPAFTLVTATIRAYSERCWLELGSNHLFSDAKSRQEVTFAGTDHSSREPSRLESNITELAASFRLVANSERKTAAEKENDELAKDVLNRFCVSFGRVVMVPHGDEPVFRPATPTIALTTLLKKTNATTAQRLCKESLRMAIRAAAASSDRWDDRVDYSEVVANSAFVQAIQQFSVFTDSVNVNHAGINTQLSLWNFLIPESSASSYENLVSENNNLLAREVLVDSKSKTTPGELKASTLYTKGKLLSIADVLSAVCNFRVFWKVYIENFDDSTMWQSLQPFLLALRHPDGKAWSTLSSGLAQVPFNLLVSLQAVVGSCFALGTIPEYVLAVKNDTTLSTQVVRGVDSLSRRLLQEVEQSITLMRPEDPLFAKVSAAMLAQGRVPGQSTGTPSPAPSGQAGASVSADSSNKRPSRGDNKRDDKRPRNAPTPDVERKKQAGMLVYSGEKLPPVCSVFITKEGSTTGERVCMFFCTKGYACTRKLCKRPHIPSLAQFPTEEKRTEFCEFVKATASLSFAEGKGPSAYVPTLFGHPARSVPAIDCLSLAPIIPDDAMFTPAPLDRMDVPTYFCDATSTHASIDEISSHQEPFMYPKSSIVTYEFKKDGTAAPVPTLNMSYTKRERARFVDTELSPRVVALLDQSFGKENLNQSFVSEACLRHCLLPLWKSGFLHGDDVAWSSMHMLGGDFSTFCDLLHDLGDVDFNSIRGFQPNWQCQQELDDEIIQKVSAALLHFDGDVAALVRWIGGPHVGAHRDVTGILENLQGKVEPGVLSELERIFTQGIPRRCVAQSTERNFQANLQYGNHKTMDEDPAKAYKALVKDVKRGFVLVFDQRLVPFLLNCHLTAQGLVDLMKLYKQPRNIFDSSFRVFSWCMAINDWTSKLTEPEIHCCAAAVPFMIWIWNLRITYPWFEIFLADNDVAGAFRWMKYHPNLCAMHTSVQCDRGVINTGGTFGDNTTPSNWDVIALSRIQASQWRWEHDPSVSTQAREYLPLPQLAALPTSDVVATFAQADTDVLNPGVLRPDGSRLPPPYDHHVDDCLYADVREHMVRTVDSSVMGLYDVLGKPCPEALNALSGDKLDNTYSHTRKGVGVFFDSRRMTVGMLDYKKEQLLEQLDLWIPLEFYTLLGAASMQGTLQDHTKFCPWVRPWFFSLQNLMRNTFTKLYHVAKRRYPTKERSAHYQKELPQSLWKRIDGLVSKDQATFLWNMNVKMSATVDSRHALVRIRDYLNETANPWETPIGLIIPRVPHSVSWGDASKFGAGGYCPILRFWFDVVWSDRVTHAVRNLKPASPGYVHINSLEFIAIILQLAGVITRLAQLEMYSADVINYFPNGFPNCYAHLAWTDNTTSLSWTNKVTTNSVTGQRLLALWSALIRFRPLALNAQHIAGSKNIMADDISRPTHFDLPHAQRSIQLCQKQEASYHADLGLFSPESRLFTAPLLAAVHSAQGGPPKSPKDLGTIRSHRIHYLMFASRMKWDDDLLLEKACPGDVRRRGLLQLSMYALHLASGNSLFCRRIQANTIEKYVKDVASFLARTGRMLDYCKTNATDTAVDPVLRAVYKELHRYDTVPNRREPFTPMMLIDCQDLARKCTDSTCLTAALGDWFAVGLNAGLRRGEWAQAENSVPSTPDLNIYDETKAFILLDTRAETAAYGRLLGFAVVSVPVEHIRKMWVRFRTQKNGQNGEERMFTRNPKKGAIGCFVVAMYRIIRRFVALCGPHDVVTPLSVYRGADGAVRLIRSFDIEHHMRAAASRVYKLHPKRDKLALQRWSSHSLRVGACVLLHAMRFSPTQIKWLLRWLSDTFMMYLRNVALLSDEHHQALDEAAGMPHFF